MVVVVAICTLLYDNNFLVVQLELLLQCHLFLYIQQENVF